MEDDPNFFGKGKRTSILLKMEAGFFFVMEDNINLFVKGRRPKKNCKWKTTLIF